MTSDAAITKVSGTELKLPQRQKLDLQLRLELEFTAILIRSWPEYHCRHAPSHVTFALEQASRKALDKADQADLDAFRQAAANPVINGFLFMCGESSRSNGA
uniref:DUF1778 domain-containing protein n=1 Tax=Ascaris lumbricoides TaxID=6252 RepID=A0A0M3HN16_ASCLU